MSFFSIPRLSSPSGTNSFPWTLQPTAAHRTFSKYSSLVPLTQ
ncbi:unnamed protein product [Spirodela intermedia]|uniref:Uncharacterized protein n=2 Tax=Spirodela intermedia TaxID=51605 RepID=A0A7I8JME1_SPIIN|nr:unnamed protein product [Spirodela intermedia]CAA6670743.1 unnamed protein product [Spirodela intermedia]CAA7407829.1 unnamed protein product [Spirodela intermedia]